MTRIPLAAGLVVALLIGANPASAAADGVAHPAAVRVETTDDLGPVFADAAGKTLYTWDGDRKAGQSLCGDTRYDHADGAGSNRYFLPDPATRPTCQQMWPPLAAAADSGPVGAFAPIVRTDGSRQWALNGKPLYTFAFDARPGEVNGAGRPGGRRVARLPLEAPAGFIARAKAQGLVLMTDKGKPLYVPTGRGLAKASWCTDGCDTDWKPLAAPAVAETTPRAWSVATLPDGARQWRFQGRTVYTYAGDTAFGELDGAAKPGWTPVMIRPRLAPPADLTVRMTGEGEVIADRNGLTTYLWSCAEEAPDRGLCDAPGTSQTYRHGECGAADTCLKTWRPVLASPGAKPVGKTWSIVEVDPTGRAQYAAPGRAGLKVWAYRGRPLYTFAGNKAPGDQNGQSLAIGVNWGYAVLWADGRGDY